MEFDSNKFYQLRWKEHPDDYTVIGTSLFKDARSGAVFLKSEVDVNDNEKLWQVFQFNETYYLLRSKEGGPKGVLAAMENDEGDTVPRMARIDIAGDSKFWTISQWEDDDESYQLRNAANGTRNLEVLDNNLMAMESTEDAESQSFFFEAIQDIDDERYSTFSGLDLPTPTSSSSSSSKTKSASSSDSTTATESTSLTNSSDPTSTPTSDSTDTTNSADSANAPASPTPESSPSSGGLSAGAAGGIGAGVSIIAVALLAALVYILRRRRQRARGAAAPVAELDDSNAPALHQHEKGAVEMEVKPAELEESPTAQGQSPVELPSADVELPGDERFVQHPPRPDGEHRPA